MPATLALPRHAPGDARRYHAIVTSVGNHAAHAPLDAAFAAGEADLRAVYDEHGGLVYAICRKALDEHSAKDVTQEVFVSAWKARDQFDPQRGALAAWLVGIAKRRIIDHLRSEGRHADRRAPEPTDHVDPHSDTEVGRTIDRMIVADAMRALPDRARQVIALAYIEGLTHHEITDRTGLPLGTVKSDIRRGLTRIRACLEATHA
jgi:RNA polymerase sigma-70 factor (ECF subfamily)